MVGANSAARCCRNSVTKNRSETNKEITDIRAQNSGWEDGHVEEREQVER
jgi:hypothetical protein